MKVEPLAKPVVVAFLFLYFLQENKKTAWFKVSDMKPNHSDALAKSLPDFIFLQTLNACDLTCAQLQEVMEGETFSMGVAYRQRQSESTTRFQCEVKNVFQKGNALFDLLKVIFLLQQSSPPALQPCRAADH